jgi:hypothetical protein
VGTAPAQSNTSSTGVDSNTENKKIGKGRQWILEALNTRSSGNNNILKRHQREQEVAT